MREHDIRSLPTFVLVDSDGRVVDSIVGSVSEKDFTNWIDGNLGVLH